MLTIEHLRVVARKGAPESNMVSIIQGLNYGAQVGGLTLPHRFIHYGAQVAHESGGFLYDEEVWGEGGGTPAQQRYDIREDLGNTLARDGDGFLYRGRTGLQATGRSNYEQFTRWCRQRFDNVPDFVAHPDLINTDPWEGLFPIFFWTTRKLNGYADSNDIEMITRRINGGLNGFDDRIIRYSNLGLVYVGYAPTQAGRESFQRAAQKAGLLPADTKDKTQIDGIMGPKSRSALHLTLVEMGKMTAAPTVIEGVSYHDTTPMPEVKAAPVTQEVAVPVPVVPEKADKTLLQRVSGLTAILAPVGAFFAQRFANLDDTGVLILGGVGVVAAGVLFWRGERIAHRANEILKSVGL